MHIKSGWRNTSSSLSYRRLLWQRWNLHVFPFVLKLFFKKNTSILLWYYLNCKLARSSYATPWRKVGKWNRSSSKKEYKKTGKGSSLQLLLWLLEGKKGERVGHWKITFTRFCFLNDTKHTWNHAGSAVYKLRDSEIVSICIPINLQNQCSI